MALATNKISDDLLSNVQALKERISVTERTLSSLSSAKSSPRQPTTSRTNRHGSGTNTPVLQSFTIDELHTTPPPVHRKGHGRSSPSPNSPHRRFRFSKYGDGGVDMVDAVFANHPLFNSGGGDSNRDDLRKRLYDLERANSKLESEKDSLVNKLMVTHTQLSEITSEHTTVSDNISTYKQLVSQLQESVVSLQNEVKALEKALRQSEARNHGTQVNAAESSKRLKQINEMLKLTEERMKEQQSLINSLRVERDNAVQLAKQLEFQEKELSTEDSQTCLELRKDVKRRDREKKSLLTRNRDLEEQLAALQNELSLKEKQVAESSHLALANKQLNLQLAELHGKVHNLECGAIESKAIVGQNAELHNQVAQLQVQLEEKEKEVGAEKKHNLQFVSDIGTLQDELKSKSSKLNTLQDEFRNMESLLQDHKQRTGTLEAQIQETEHIKMENVELKCQLEESEKKLTLCQQEIQVTSDQLGRLETLACKIESKEKITATYDGEELVQLRSQLICKNSEVCELQIALDDAESRLKLTQLALDAKEKVQKKAEKIGSNSERSRLLSEVSRLKSKLSENDGRSQMLDSRMKEVQTEMSSLRKRLETSQQTNKNLKQQKLASESEIKSLKQRLLEVEKSSQVKSADLEEQCSVSDRLQHQVINLKKELQAKRAEKDEHLDSLQQQCDHWQQQLAAFQKQKDGLRDELSSLQKEYATSQAALIKLESQIETKEKSIDKLNKEMMSAREETDAVNAELSSQLKSSESRLTHLESALSVTRQECEALANQLREDKSSYQAQLDEKDAFIKEYQARLKTSQTKAQDYEVELSRLIEELQTNKQMSREDSGKVRQLEEQHATLNSQVHEMEQTLKRVTLVHKGEIETLKRNLECSLEEVEHLKLNEQQLHNKVTDLEKDRSSLLVEVESLEKKLAHSSAADKSRLGRLAELEADMNEKQEMLEKRDNDVISLESKLQKMELDLEHHNLLNSQFEGEFRRAQNDLKSAMSQCEELQDALSRTQEEKRSLEGQLRKVEKSLAKAHEEIKCKTSETEELEDQIRSQEKQLLSRAQQVSQLDVTISSYRSELNSQLQHTTQQLAQCQKDCDQRTAEMQVLRNELTQTASELNARQTELAASQADVRKLHSDLQEKSKKVCDLEERLDGLEAKSSGLLQGLSTQTEETEAKNELIRKYRAEVEHLQFELTETKIERETMLEKYNQSKQELQAYLDTTYKLEQRLASCEQSQFGKSESLEGARRELKELQLQHHKEIARLEDAQENFIEMKQELEKKYESRVRELEKREKQLMRQLQLSQDQCQQLRDELSRRLELVKNANEAVVIKEAEIARLQARVSGVERKWAVYNASATDHTQATSRSDWSYSQVGELKSLPSTISKDEGSADAQHCDHMTNADLQLLKQRATRKLFSPEKSANGETVHDSSSVSHTLEAADNNELEDCKETTLYLENTTSRGANDSTSSNDDILARERLELFNKLDELNSQHVESMTQLAASETVAQLMQSALTAAATSESEAAPPDVHQNPQEAPQNKPTESRKAKSPDDK